MSTKPWQFNSDVAKEFGVDELAANSAQLRDALKQMMASIHPDKNGGDFKSNEEKERFLRVKEGLDFVELQEQASVAMIPVSQLPAIISALTQSLAVRLPSDLNVLQSSYLTDARASISRRYLFPKISSGVFLALFGFFATFGDKFAKQPVLAKYLASEMWQVGLLVLAVYSGLFFAFTWMRERQAEVHAEFIMSEYALREIFKDAEDCARRDEVLPRISSRHFRRAIEMRSRGRVDLPVLEKAVSIQTQRLIQRKLITPTDESSIDAWYEIQGQRDGSIVKKSE